MAHKDPIRFEPRRPITAHERRAIAVVSVTGLSSIDKYLDDTLPRMQSVVLTRIARAIVYLGMPDLLRPTDRHLALAPVTK